jgi:hypothetical protein
MPVNNTIEVAGVKDALRELNDIDKKLRRQITRDYQKIVSPVVNTAKSFVPPQAPLSGFNRYWTPQGASGSVLPVGPDPGREPKKGNYQSRQGRRQYGEWKKWKYGIRGYVSGKRPRTVGGYTRNLAAFGIRWLGSAAVLFDTSGQADTPQGQRMVAALNARFGQPSRVMWRAYERESLDVQQEMRDLVNDIMRAVDRKTNI